SQVAPPTVDVDLLPQVAHRHRRALDVPARPPRSKLRRPRRLVGSRPPPQGEIKEIPLRVRTDPAEQPLVAQLAQHRLARPVGKPTETRVPADVEVKSVCLVG